MLLEDISYGDKIWLVTKVLDKMTLVKWSLACAESVVHLFNDKFPEDNRVNDCLETVRKYINGEVDESAWSAARSAWSAAESAESAEKEQEQEQLNLKLLGDLL